MRVKRRDEWRTGANNVIAVEWLMWGCVGQPVKCFRWKEASRMGENRQAWQGEGTKSIAVIWECIAGERAWLEATQCE